MDVASIKRLENKHLRVDVFPEGGGKLVSIYNKKLKYEFLWDNEALNLEAYGPGTEYDPVFYGGVDELLPNDIPENVDGMEFPDHGELWTQPLSVALEGDGLELRGHLPVSKLGYKKTIRLDSDGPFIHTDYKIENGNAKPVKFLWKLHAALKIKAGDRVLCQAGKGQVVDPGYSRFGSTAPFQWPVLGQTDVSLVPEKNGTMDFFYLYDLECGSVGLENVDGHYFGYAFDKSVFPYVWLFASYGGFLGHYTAVLEPCTTMPISVNDAAKLGQALILQPGESLKTRVTTFAGDKNKFIHR